MEDPRFQTFCERFYDGFMESHLVGENTRHSRADNLQSIRRLIEGHWHYTFGIEGLEVGSPETVLKQISDLTGCSSDITHIGGGGKISAKKCLRAVFEAGERLRNAKGKTVFLGTGHPGSLLGFYLGLRRVLLAHDIKIAEPTRAMLDTTREVDSIEQISVVEDRAGILHSHEVEVGYIAFEGIRDEIALAFCDHAYAGAALNYHIPLIAIMDTNDPAFAVAKAQGRDLTIIPLDDNRPLTAYTPLLDAIKYLLEL